MTNRIRVNTADYRELLGLPGIGVEQANRIVRFRREHGPIVNESELSRVLGWRALHESMWGRVDFTTREEPRPPRGAVSPE